MEGKKLYAYPKGLNVYMEFCYDLPVKVQTEIDAEREQLMELCRNGEIDSSVVKETLPNVHKSIEISTRNYAKSQVLIENTINMSSPNAYLEKMEQMIKDGLFVPDVPLQDDFFEKAEGWPLCDDIDEMDDWMYDPDNADSPIYKWFDWTLGEYVHTLENEAAEVDFLMETFDDIGYPEELDTIEFEYVVRQEE